MQKRLTAFHTKPRKPMKRSAMRRTPRQKPPNAPGRTKLPKMSTMRNKCDNLLTPLIQRMYPHCLLRGAQNCAVVTQVAHHHVHKSKSSRLRYDLENLIPLCGACHVMLHNDESFWGAKVAQIRGPEWFSYIEKAKHENVKTDVHFYIAAHERLTKLLSTVEG